MIWSSCSFFRCAKLSVAISCCFGCSCVIFLIVQLTLQDGGRFLELSYNHMKNLTYTSKSKHDENISVFGSLEQPYNFLKNLALDFQQHQQSNANGSCLTHFYDHRILKFLFPDRIQPWFLSSQSQFHQSLQSTSTKEKSIWPEEGKDDDRIVDQLLYANAKNETKKTKPVAILLYDGFASWYFKGTPGRDIPVHSVEDNCPVRNCLLTANVLRANFTDVVISKRPNFPSYRPPHQLRIRLLLESPWHSLDSLERFQFNLTASFHHKSDIVTPYGKWVYYDDSCRNIPQSVNYAAGKTRKVAWFVSNCYTENRRLNYAQELSKYIKVDIYGSCGNHSCSRQNSTCFDLLSKHYKFYLAFENSNCRDYITEKFFSNALRNNVIPVVMGAHPDDYRRIAPEKSYIHVDDFPSPKELALHLHLLDNNDDLYNEYFRWKGTGEFIPTYFFCRLCAMVRDAQEKPRSAAQQQYPWWNIETMCTSGSWKEQKNYYYLTKT